MTAFDTDILSLILRGDPVYGARLLTVAPLDRCVPVVAAAECLRGWLNAIRQAEAGKGRMSLEGADAVRDPGAERERVRVSGLRRPRMWED